MSDLTVFNFGQNQVRTMVAEQSCAETSMDKGDKQRFQKGNGDVYEEASMWWSAEMSLVIDKCDIDDLNAVLLDNFDDVSSDIKAFTPEGCHLYVKVSKKYDNKKSMLDAQSLTDFLYSEFGSIIVYDANCSINSYYNKVGNIYTQPEFFY